MRFLRNVHPDVDQNTPPAHEDAASGSPESPILVFINPKSGGKCGPLLQKLLVQGLGERQASDNPHYLERKVALFRPLSRSQDAVIMMHVAPAACCGWPNCTTYTTCLGKMRRREAKSSL